MKKIANFIVNKRIWIIIVFSILVIASAICIPFVKTNYNDLKYFPKDTDVIKGIDILEENFGSHSDARCMAVDVTVEKAILLKDEISKIEGISQVSYIDDMLMPFISKPIADANITKAKGIQYFIDIIVALPDDIASMSPLELMGIISKLHTEPEFTVFYTGLASMFTADKLIGLELLKKEIPNYFKDFKALYTIEFANGSYDAKTTKAIKELSNIDNLYISGQTYDIYKSQIRVERLTNITLIIVVLVVLVILFLTSSAYLEPLIYILVIIAAIILNFGSNILLGDVSSMTSSIAHIMQLVLTIDYSIFLMNKYKEEKQIENDSQKAVKKAWVRSISPISASSFTTVASFIALMFMQYRIGFDIGVVLGKGVLLSLITVFLLMPGLIVVFNKGLDKTKHKELRFGRGRYKKFLYKSRFILPIILMLVFVPSILMQKNNNFKYGTTYVSHQEDKVRDDFGREENIVLLIKNVDKDLELSISQKIYSLKEEGVKRVVSYELVKTTNIPASMLSALENQMVGKAGYRRIIITSNIENEGQKSENLINKINDILNKEYSSKYSNYKKDYYLVGAATANITLKDIFEEDNLKITILINVMIFLILLIVFKSILIPLLLIIVIQGAIGMASMVPLIFNMEVPFVAYLLVTTLLLGATIDYAILVTNNYFEKRKEGNKTDAFYNAVDASARSLITSASIFGLGGFGLLVTAATSDIRMFGIMIFSGAFFAFAMVMSALPQGLYLLDKAITRNKKKKDERN